MKGTAWQRAALTAAGLLVTVFTAPLYAEGYDYIRGDDVYEEDYQYGLDYDGLSSVPQSSLSTGSASSSGNAEGRLQKRALELQENTTQPSMTRELDRWKPDSKLTTPGKSTP